MYFDSEHYRRVQEFSKNITFEKTKKASYANKTDQKNYHILRHVFERMRQTCGVYDGLRGRTNYTKNGKAKKIPWGSPESLWDAHVVEWQKELIREGLIKPEDVLSPGTLYSYFRWTVTCQKETSTFRHSVAAIGRRAAVNAYWLLTADLIKIEEANFGVTSSEAVTSEPDEM
jgi:hypothetical protein